METKVRNRILFVLFIGVLMGALDIAIVGPALPTIRKAFAVDNRQGAWIFSIYILFNLIGTPIMAKLSDLYGRRLVYITDVSLFGLGSLVSALAPSFAILLLGRSIQGFGAGGIFPVASAVIGDTFPTEKRGGALGLIGAVFGIAFLFGPPLGGVITTFFGWHWIFLINIPIALLVIVMSLRLLPSIPLKNVAAFDWKGMIFLSLTLGSLAYSINQIDTGALLPSLASMSVLPYLVISLISLIILISIERKSVNPLLPPHLFTRKQLKLTYILTAGAGVSEASMVFMPALALAALPTIIKTPLSASYMMMPVVLAMAIGSPTAGRFLDKLGSKSVILAGTAIMTAGMLSLSFFSGSLTMFIISGLLIGLGLSALLGAPIRYIMLGEAQATERSVAQGTATLFTSIGQLISGALVGAVASNGNYSAAYMVIGVVGILMMAPAFFLKDRAAELDTINNHGILIDGSTSPASNQG
jgi:EmrB/QacA subfamily drug resistance transporter